MGRGPGKEEKGLMREGNEREHGEKEGVMWGRKGPCGEGNVYIEMKAPGGKAQGVKEGPRKGMKGPRRTGGGQGEGMGKGGKARTMGGGSDMEGVLHAVFRYRTNSAPWAVKG